MAKQIAKLLKADLNESGDLKAIAKMLQSKGRGGDTMLAHITRREAEILKAAGGAGTINPETGLPEFYEPDALDTWFSNYYASQPAVEAAPVQSTDSTPVAQTETPAYTRTSADNQALYGNEGYTGYGGNLDRAALYGDYGYGPASTAPGTTSLPGGEAVAGTELFGGGYYGITPGAGTVSLQRGGTVGLPPTPAQADVLYRTQLPEYKYGYGLTEGAPSAGVPQDLTKPAEKSFFDKLSTDQLVRLGLTGALGLYGSQQAKKAAEQGRAGAEEQKALGVPYQTKGAELQRAAAAGELTPAGQQSLQALQARLAQGVESRGGVGAAQAAAQLEAYRQQLLQGQYDYGIKVSQIGDSIALGAIRTGMQADQQLNQANTAFYTNLAMIGAGIPMRTT